MQHCSIREEANGAGGTKEIGRRKGKRERKKGEEGGRYMNDIQHGARPDLIIITATPIPQHYPVF